ncbi:unnamed protein product [Paramecium octaurelia]|uniref:Uncharacterized protein n=1 Tax=Paramecium octaurelia TaxID=43137 RepID=A0A8S1YNR0_PAROT|nr:unnamed protein product [Paramecium octaurelia]
MISRSVYGMIRQENQKPMKMVIQVKLIQFVTLLMEIHQHLFMGSQDRIMKSQNQMVIHVLFFQFVTFLNGNTLAPCNNDNSICLWDVKTVK